MNPVVEHAVADDGVGLPTEGWRRDSPHGLNILEAQMRFQAGDKSKLRVFRRPCGGTLAVMRLTVSTGGAA